MSSQNNSRLVTDNKVDKTSSERDESFDLEEQVKQNIEKSMDYQIITKVMNYNKADDSEKNLPVGKHTNALKDKNDTAVLGENNKITLNTSSESAQSSQNVQSSTGTLSIVTEAAEASLSVSRFEGEIQQSDPLALDLNGDGLHTTGVEQGVLFDINGDGIKEQTSFVHGGDAFLAYDKNGNGVIDNGKELFGDNNGYQHGFSELASYDEDQNGQIDKNDSIYEKLQLFSIDKNGRQQLAGLKDSGVASIKLDYTHSNQTINQYDTIAQLGQFEYQDGRTGTSGDLLLGHKSA
jgi:hypothetical protein